MSKMPIKEFLDHCTACGGNWTQMFMTGIKECFPKTWESMLDDKTYSFEDIAIILEPLVDWPHDKNHISCCVTKKINRREDIQ